MPAAGTKPATDTGSAAGPLKVITASYGSNVNSSKAANNATADIAKNCDGKQSCDYIVDRHRIGDTFYGSKKDYNARYTCGSSEKTGYAAPDAGLGSHVVLSCP